MTATSSSGTGATPRASKSRGEGHEPVIFDLGTGLRNYGDELAAEGRVDGYRATVLLTHLHWDHIQGLPFFAPLAGGGGAVTVIGPHQEAGPLDRRVPPGDEPAVLPDHPRGAAG